MDSLEEMLRKEQESRAEDAKKFADLNGDICMCCGAQGEDKRSLFIDCFYKVKEVVPDALDISEVEPKLPHHKQGYYLRICKACRGRFLSMMGEWWKEGIEFRGLPMDHDGNLENDDPERNIPVRVNGAIKMLTRKEWDIERCKKWKADAHSTEIPTREALRKLEEEVDRLVKSVKEK